MRNLAMTGGYLADREVRLIGPYTFGVDVAYLPFRWLEKGRGGKHDPKVT